MKNVLTSLDYAFLREYFGKSDCEKVIIGLLKTESQTSTIKWIIPVKENYRSIGKYRVSLSPEYLLKYILEYANGHYEAFIIIHNHTLPIPLFSKTDKLANGKLKKFFQKNSIPIYIITAVYAASFLSYWKMTEKTKKYYFRRTLIGEKSNEND